MAGSTSKSQVAALLASARRHPGTEEGIACAGTSLESRTITVRGKAFAFFGAGALRLKLRDSLAEAQACAARSPELYQAGASGWVRVTLGDAPLPLPMLRRWLDESHALFAGPRAAVAKASTRKPPSKRPTKAPRR